MLKLKTWKQGPVKGCRLEDNVAGSHNQQQFGSLCGGCVLNPKWWLRIKPKLKHFLWKCLHCILPVNVVVHKRLGKGDPFCKCCGEELETLEHMLFFCSAASQVWSITPVQWDGLLDFRQDFWSWWRELSKAMQEHHGLERIELSVYILWFIRKDRNGFQFQAKSGSALKIINNAVNDWLAYKEANAMAMAPGRHADQVSDLQPTARVCNFQLIQQVQNTSQASTVLLYADAALHKASNRAGLGIVATDSDGKLLKIWAKPQAFCRDAELEEAEAIRTALLIARREQWQKVKLHSDCQGIVESLNKNATMLRHLGTILDDIRQLIGSFTQCLFVYINRHHNSMSHKVAKFAVKLVTAVEWEVLFPVWLLDAAVGQRRQFVDLT